MLSSKYNFICKVIQSCKTEKQLESCLHWIKNVELGPEAFDSYFNYCDLSKLIVDMKVYIKKLDELKG